MQSELTALSNYFNLVKVDDSTIRSDPPHSAAYIEDITFGGLIVSQAVNAFIMVNPFLVPHTVNYKFIAPVKPTFPIHYKLSSYDDCHIFRVFVYQNERIVGVSHIQFATEPELLDSSQFPCPSYGPPSDYANHLSSEISESMSNDPLETRPIESPLCPMSEKPRISYWMRIKPEVRDSVKPSDGLPVLLFISDFASLQVAEEILLKSRIRISLAASLHHSVWIHEAQLDPLGWYLPVIECEVISYGRVRIESHIFNETRKCVMTVVQEGYLQRKEEKMKL